MLQPNHQLIQDDQLQDSEDTNADAAGARGLPATRAQIFSEGDENAFRQATIMLIDDDLLALDLAQAFLQDAGYEQLIPVNQPTRAVELIRAIRPDVVLLDLMMPEVSGFEILAEVRGDEDFIHLPVIVITSSTESEYKLKALEQGATDFIGKPVDPSELALRVRNNLGAKAHQDGLASYSSLLEEEVAKRTLDLESAQFQIILSLARASEYRDDDTGKHVVRVGRYAALIAQQLGLPETFVETIEIAAPLHDVGKIGIPDGILLKPGRLDSNEFAFIKRHCEMGHSIICPETNPMWQELRILARSQARLGSMSISPVMRMAAAIALTHHEKWDGSGYPKGLKGEEIPVEGRISAVADVFDALSSKRPYKDPFPREKCLEIIKDGRGAHFDPKVVDAFFRVLDEIIEIQDVLRE